MSPYRALATAFVAFAFLEGALAAQQILIPEERSIESASTTAPSHATSKPARPTGLVARAASTSETLLTWSDNATNEHEYRLEIFYEGAWQDLGAIPPQATSIYVIALEPATTYFFRMRARNNVGYSPYSNEAAVLTFVEPSELVACKPGPGVMCLHGGRYRVEARYEGDDDMAGTARAVTITDDSGYFWFFDAVNIEVIVKMIDGCNYNDRQWVFTTGLTNLRVLVTVVDTRTGATAAYLNELGRPFAPVQDTSAFDTCN